MPVVQYTGASPLQYDAVLGRSWSVREFATVDATTLAALVASGPFADVSSLYATPTGPATGVGAVSSVAGRIGDVVLSASDLTDDARIEAALASIPQTALAVHAVPISGGSWDASANSPTITSGTAPTDGVQCRTVSVAGTTTVDGQSVWKVGDTITWNGTVWYRTATFPRSSGATGLVSTDSSGNPSTLAGGSAAGPVMIATDGTPTIGKVGTDVGAPIFAVCTQPFGVAPSASAIGANGGAFTAGTAFIETYGPTGAIPYDGIWLWFEAGATDTGSAAGFYWTVMTSTTAGTVYNNYLAPGNSGLNKPPATPTLYTTNVGKGSTSGTTSQILGWLITLPANTLGANGTYEIDMSLRSNGSAGTKALTPKLGGGNFGFGAGSSSTSTVVDASMRAFNVNNTSRQRALLRGTTGTSVLTTAPANASVNTTAATTIGLDLSHNTATDIVVCQYAAIKIWPAA